MARGKREAKRTYGLGKRFMAMFLAVVMCTSMLQLTAFAAEEPTSGKVMEGSFVLNTDGTIATDAEGTTNGVISGDNHDTVTYDDGVFALTKSVEKTGENQFDVTLKVVTTQTVSKTYDSSATVLVLDMSNSMDYNFGDQTTRLNEAEKVAKEFLASYAGTDADAEQYLSIVWFGTGSGVDQAWVNVAGGAGQNSYDTVYNYLDALNEAPHSGDTDGTNLDAGLRTVQNQLALRSDIDEYKNVVVITDGKPTYRLNTNGTGTSGNGSSGSKDNNDAAAARADAIQETATIYTVCIAAESDVCYSDSTQNVCEYCEKSRDNHLEVDLCQNCDQEFAAHDKHSGWFGSSYYTCPGNQYSYYYPETHYYCDATHATEYKNTSVTVSGVTVGDFLKNDIASSTSNAYNASSAEELENALAAIAAKIEESGSSGKDTTVTDPMGEFITMGDVTIDGVTNSASGLTWALDPENADKNTVGDVTTYTYTITYPITLDTADPDFEEVYTTDETAEDYNAELAGKTKYYPTNGYTYLSIPQEGGEPRKLAFRVPGVAGDVPEVDWTVEYYLQDADSIGGDPTYTKDDEAAYGPVDVWTPVNAPDGYKTKYASTTGDDYVFASGEVTMTVTPTGENVMRLYYDLVTADVTVEHYYKTDYIQINGTEVPGVYPQTPNTVTGPTTWKVNNDYTATPVTEYNSAEYTLDEEMSDDLTIKVAKVAEDGENPNVIKLYYTRVIDDSVKTSVQVNHVYRTYAYELGADGKYGAEPVLQSSKTEEAQKATNVFATTRFDVSNQPIDGYKDQDYELNTEEGDYSELLKDNGTLSFIVDEEAENNIRTLYFDKVIDRRVPVTVTVNHYYTKSVTSVDADGKVVTTVDPNGVKGNTSTVNAYAGETFTAAEINDYNDDEYISDPGNEAKLVIRALPIADSVIDLYYSLTEVPEKATVYANHYWRTFTEVTIELTETTTDADGNEVTTVVGTDTETRVSVDNKIEDIPYTDLYVGQKHVEAQKEWGEGYEFNDEESVDTVYAGEGKEAVMYYDKDATADERHAASITVQHVYTTHLTTIVDGAVDVVTTTVSSDLEPYTGKAGDSFTAAVQFEFGGNTYTMTTADAELTKILQPGTNATIVINYERAADDRVATNYSVDHVYKTYTMTVKDGVAGYYEDPAVETVEGQEIPGYVGESVSLNDGAKAGFTALTTNPATTQTLAASGNEWTFVHEKYVPLDKGSVVVNHYYSCQTIALKGTITWTSSSSLGNPVEKYLGESYTAVAVPDGYEQMDSILDGAAFAAPYELTVSGDHVVDFHYKKVVDQRKTADYTVTHDYYLYDYNGTLLSHPDPETVTFTGYVAHPVTVNPDDTDYTLTKVTFNDKVLTEAPYTEYLVEGENAFVFTYVKTLPRDKVNVKVIHNYYKDEASMTGETAKVESQYVETIQNVPEDTEYTAVEHVLKDAAYTYTWHSADPENKTIVAVDDVDEAGQTVNVIIMNYIRATAKYQVIHIYNRNNVEEGRTETTLGGLDGEVILADSIERVPVYEGRTYTFKSITGDLVLNAEEQQVIILDSDEMQTVTLIYNRTVSSGGGGGGGTVIIPENPVPQDPAPQPEPEPVVPEVEEIPEEDVPMASVPMTGDTTALYALLAMGSAMGLMYLWLTGKKREEEI